MVHGLATRYLPTPNQSGRMKKIDSVGNDEACGDEIGIKRRPHLKQ
jgi:hypothetical protein